MGRMVNIRMDIDSSDTTKLKHLIEDLKRLGRDHLGRFISSKKLERMAISLQKQKIFTF